MTSESPTISSKANRLERRFAEWRRGGRCALIPYLTAGYPEPEMTHDLLRRFAAAGADVIELGVPFSDPLADGPTIQRSSQRALEHGVSLDWTLQALERFRAEHDTPIVIFSYLNPVLAAGAEAFLERAAKAGADGILLTDLPLDGDPALETAIEASPLSLIRLIAPTTPPERAAAIAARAQGFVYYIARTGVTGATATLREALRDEVDRLRAVTNVPIAVGFGISDGEQAATVARAADGVVVGSALIDAMDGGGAEAAEALLVDLRTAIDGVSG